MPQKIVADYVALCAGLHVTPSIPHIPGVEHIFKSSNLDGANCPPVIFHSVHYKVRSQLAGRRVMILGNGETGMDLTYEAVKAGAKQVILCSRSGHVFNIYGLPCVPFSYVFIQIFVVSEGVGTEALLLPIASRRAHSE